jgi:hypothetical protein
MTTQAVIRTANEEMNPQSLLLRAMVTPSARRTRCHEVHPTATTVPARKTSRHDRIFADCCDLGSRCGARFLATVALLR